MHNFPLIEECYKKFIKSLFYWIPEGIFLVNLELLHHFDLLHFQPATNRKDPNLTRYFHIIESSEKITLLNDDFIVWIIPDKINQMSVTYTLIALNKPEQEHQLEAAFIASGVYNSSKLVLRILEKFLAEIHDNEKMLAKFKATA
jgi:hypothetical protein